jgi:hypothetical protein
MDLPRGVVFNQTYLALLESGRDHAVQIGGMFCPQTPSPSFYVTLAQEYSRRHVNEKHREDRFLAFSSIESVLEKSYPGGFIQCIPECLFAKCLLWIPDTSPSRQARGRQVGLGSTNLHLSTSPESSQRVTIKDFEVSCPGTSARGWIHSAFRY